MSFMPRIYRFFLGKSRSDGDFGVVKKGIPARLQDDLHWKCSSCRSLVATNETHNHLMGCFDTILDSLLDESKDKNLRAIMELDDRPRTKRLERPTPNIRHPVIDDHNCDKRYSKGSGSNFFDTKIQSKSIFARNSRRNNFLRANIAVPVNRNAKNACNSCERPSAPERFHSHNEISGGKSYQDIRTGNDVESVDFPIREKCYDPLSSKMKCYLCKNDFGPEEMADHEAECIEVSDKFLIFNVSDYESSEPGTRKFLASVVTFFCLQRWKRENTVTGPTEKVTLRKLSLSSLPGCDPEGWEHFKSQLTPCLKCGRSFFPHRLATHEKACRGPENKPHHSRAHLPSQNSRGTRKNMINHTKPDKMLGQASSKIDNNPGSKR